MQLSETNCKKVQPSTNKWNKMHPSKPKWAKLLSMHGILVQNQTIFCLSDIPVKIILNKRRLKTFLL